MRSLPYAFVAGVLLTSALAASTPAVGASLTDGPPPSDPNGVFSQNCDPVFNGPPYLPQQIDPILAKGTAHPNGPHLHDFFGFTMIDENTDSATMRDQGPWTEDYSSCSRVKNRSAYWSPVLYLNHDTPFPTPPSTMRAYYRRAGIVQDSPAHQVKTLPNMFGMIAGDSMASAAQEERIVRWHCVRGGDEATGGEDPAMRRIPDDCFETTEERPPGLDPYNGELRMRIIFPNCWDGEEADLPYGAAENGKSHVTYAWRKNDGTPQGGPTPEAQCPSDFPIAIPELTIGVRWLLPVGYRGENALLEAELVSDRMMRLGTGMHDPDPDHRGGWAAHADFINGWEPELLENLVTFCIQDSHDCPDDYVPVDPDGRAPASLPSQGPEYVTQQPRRHHN